MTYTCSCDYGDVETQFYRATIRTASKTHKCEECGGQIKPSERYEYVSAMWDGDLATIKTCERCYDLRTWVKNNVPCLCIMHGNQFEENENAIAMAYERARDEVVGLRFGYARRVYKLKQHNRSAA